MSDPAAEKHIRRSYSVRWNEYKYLSTCRPHVHSLARRPSLVSDGSASATSAQHLPLAILLSFDIRPSLTEPRETDWLILPVCRGNSDDLKLLVRVPGACRDSRTDSAQWHPPSVTRVSHDDTTRLQRRRRKSQRLASKIPSIYNTK